MKLRTLFALIPSVIFCFWYLPFKQAIKIPIIIYCPRIFKFGGRVIIDSDKIYFGMIRLGLFITNQYPNAGIRWYNKGTIVFKGKACIGANSAITVLRPSSYLEFGENFGNVTTLRINCDYRIVFRENVLMGWDVSVADSAMHRTKDLEGNFTSLGYGEILIGKNSWIASQCFIMQNTDLPDYTIVGARSITNKRYNIPAYSFIAGTPAHFIKNGIWRDLNDDKIEIKP
ncbi:hypothetical protein NW211_12340 [Barnesiella sp. ET7]|uniref:hypothetical protein n=1 Tax=Barnesiella sp. ET7 TaxID=2972460 RepID=UPI0021ACADB9|nr:hypothetical protein [Barnesiella sp. ET7]MCR8912780.1 hypothetical protein [Barnesiella sp. ET7]